MAVTVAQNLEGAQNTGLATVTVTHSAATPGSTLILIVGSDDYRTVTGSIPESSGYALVTGGAQQTFLGHYMWFKVASGGETSVSYTIGSAATSCWEFYEITGLDQVSPLDISSGQLTGSSGATYTTTTLTPSAGERYLVATLGGSVAASQPVSISTWLNSFTALNDTFVTLASGTRDMVGAAALQVTANGSTSYSTGATYNPSMESRTAILAAFKVASTSSAPVAQQLVMSQAVNRSYTY